MQCRRNAGALPVKINLLSDTQTRPTPAMREAMARAEVGDEQIGDDPTVNLLCERVADLLGKEAAVFMPSGTMCNVAATLVHCRAGDEILAHETAHIIAREGGAHAALGGFQITPLKGDDGQFSPEALKQALERPTFTARKESGMRRDAAAERQADEIGARIGELKNSPQGYDNCYVLTPGKEKMQLAARVRHPKSGRVMEIHTTQPAVQFYSGNFLDGKAENGKYPQYSGFCLETQHFPDSPNQPSFPNTILRPGEHFRQVTVFKFSTE